MKRKISTILTALLGGLTVPLLTFALSVQLCNPLAPQGQCDTVIDPTKLYASVLRALFGVVGVVALFFFVVGGILWLTSGGNPEKIKKGANTLLWATLGLVAIFMSFILVAFVLNIFSESSAQ